MSKPKIGPEEILVEMKAIEEEDVQALPAPVYLKGFLRTYAKALGLDPYRVTEEYLERIRWKGYQKD